MRLQTPQPLRSLLASRSVVPSRTPFQKNRLLCDVTGISKNSLCALARLARLISKTADAIVICLHAFVLALDKRSYVRRKVLRERCFIGAFCNIFAALAFGQHGMFVLSSDRRFDVGTSAMQRTGDSSGGCGFASERPYLGLQFSSATVASPGGILEHRLQTKARNGFCASTEALLAIFC